jgi:hypothetical protein
MPLAISQAAAYIKQREPRSSIQEYLVKLEKSERSRLGLRTLLPYAKLATNLKPKSQDASLKLDSICGKAASFVLSQGFATDAEHLVDKSLRITRVLLGDEHLETLTSMTSLAETYRDQVRWKKAEKLEVLVMGTSNRTLGKEHPQTLTSMANLAGIYSN